MRFYGSVLALAAFGFALAFGCSSSDSSDDGVPAGGGTTNGGEAGAPLGDGGTTTLPDGAVVPVTPGSLDEKKAEMMTSIWENSTTIFQYGFSRNNDDGCGYTSGRIGFCTGTGDSLEVVQCFDKAFGTGSANLMAKYVNELQRLKNLQLSSGQSQDDVSGLDGIGDYNADWKKTATDAASGSVAFDACQDTEVEQEYYEPAESQVKKWGLTTALSLAAFYDANVEQGAQGIDPMVAAANKDVGNASNTPPSAPLSLTDESNFLKAFLQHRATILKNDDGWKGGVDRVANYEKLRAAGNWDLSAPIVTDAKANAIFSGGGYIDAQFPVCTIAADGTVTGDPECTAPVAN